MLINLPQYLFPKVKIEKVENNYTNDEYNTIEMFICFELFLFVEMIV